jgi:leucine dehydrogenase
MANVPFGGADAGAELFVSVVREDRVKAVDAFGARSIAPEAINEVGADVFSPCALGAIINDIALPVLKAVIVAGGANNQLGDEIRHGSALRERGILYAPDYVVNGGGMIQLALERTGLNWDEVHRRVRRIGDMLSSVFERADRTNVSTSIAATEMARECIESAPREAA